MGEVGEDLLFKISLTWVDGGGGVDLAATK